MARYTSFKSDGIRDRADRLDNVEISSAATEIAFQLMANRGLVGMAMAFEQIHRCHDHAGRAEPALKRMMFLKCGLKRMQLAGLRQSFDCDNGIAIGLNREHGTALDGFVVQHHGTGAADRSLAADVRAGEAARFTQIVDQKQARFHLVRVWFAVDGERDFPFHVRIPDPFRGPPSQDTKLAEMEQKSKRGSLAFLLSTFIRVHLRPILINQEIVSRR